MAKWIPTKRKLPEVRDEHDVLIVVDEGDPFEPYSVEGEYRGRKEWLTRHGIVDADDVTHWMEKPALPRRKASKRGDTHV